MKKLKYKVDYLVKDHIFYALDLVFQILLQSMFAFTDNTKY